MLFLASDFQISLYRDSHWPQQPPVSACFSFHERSAPYSCSLKARLFWADFDSRSWLSSALSLPFSWSQKAWKFFEIWEAVLVFQQRVAKTISFLEAYMARLSLFTKPVNFPEKFSKVSYSVQISRCSSCPLGRSCSWTSAAWSSASSGDPASGSGTSKRFDFPFYNRLIFKDQQQTPPSFSRIPLTFSSFQLLARFSSGGAVSWFRVLDRQFSEAFFLFQQANSATHHA